MIEVEVHQQLRAFLREQGEPHWHHHLTMARLVARAFRLQRSALIQTGATSSYQGRYRLSYLMPALMWQGPVVVVAPEAVQQRLLLMDIPRLREWIPTPKPIQMGDRPWGEQDSFEGIVLITPEAWLSRQLSATPFPEGIVTIMDGVDDLEAWAQHQLMQAIEPSDWNELMLAYPTLVEAIRDTRIYLTREIFRHPINPYECYLLEAPEQLALQELFGALSFADPNLSYLPHGWARFWRRFNQEVKLLWAAIARESGHFTLHCGPAEVASTLLPLWDRQPVVLIGGALDLDADAPIYRQRLGLGDLTCVKFSPDRQAELIQLYLPDRIPLPNTSQYRSALIEQIRLLITASANSPGTTVVLIGDVPLKAQVGSILAAEWGSRVQVERPNLDDEQGILITGWDFWHQHQARLPIPHLLVIATLPFPSLEEPWVAGRVAYHRQARQDWFRLYLLPQALRDLQRAIAPIRSTQGIVALLDNRVNHRSYGQQVLNALSPLARINYVDASLFSQINYSA